MFPPSLFRLRFLLFHSNPHLRLRLSQPGVAFPPNRSFDNLLPTCAIFFLQSERKASYSRSTPTVPIISIIRPIYPSLLFYCFLSNRCVCVCVHLSFPFSILPPLLLLFLPLLTSNSDALDTSLVRFSCTLLTT